MTWNWQRPSWPNFSYDPTVLDGFEQQFLLHAGEFVGIFRHIGADDQDALRIELVGEEAVKTSEIEGEILDRESVQSSLRHQFGFGPEPSGVRPAERGIANMMVDLYARFDAPLTGDTLLAWHGMLMAGNRSIHAAGAYRSHADAMQVVSGPLHKPKVHFQAPLSNDVPAEMRRFIAWFGATAPCGTNALPALRRAGLAHLYFVCIHPFEDGNGRIARALSEKAIAQNLGHPSLLALAYTIERKRKDYYAALERNNKSLEITDWLDYFARTVLEAQDNTIRRVDFHLAKSKFYQGLHGRLNARQNKVIARMFREGIDGFKGGLSAENYISIAGTSRSTATRDLQDLVEKRALRKSGELRYARYHLDLQSPAKPRESLTPRTAP